MSRNSWQILNLVGLALGASVAMTVGGCKKPPPPLGACCAASGTCSNVTQANCATGWQGPGSSCNPNPCPQPPPPPQPVALKTLGENEHADARVQFADGVEVPEDQVDLGKAIVHLADAMAKGDAKALKPMLTRPAQNLLQSLVDNGDWEMATKPIEAVRVVLLRDGVDFGGVAAPTVPTGEVATTIQAKVMEAMKGLTPEQMAAMGKAMQEAMTGVDPATLMSDPSKLEELRGKLKAAMAAAGVSEEMQAKLDEVGKQASAPDAAPAPTSSTGTGVLMAIQDLHGAYVLGWSAVKVGDKWAFANAPSTAEVRPRASLWDGVGPEAFQAMALASAPAPRMPMDDGAASGGKPGSGEMGGGGGGGGEPSPSSPSPSPSPSPVAPPARAPGAPGPHR